MLSRDFGQIIYFCFIYSHYKVYFSLAMSCSNVLSSSFDKLVRGSFPHITLSRKGPKHTTLIVPRGEVTPVDEMVYTILSIPSADKRLQLANYSV